MINERYTRAIAVRGNAQCEEMPRAWSMVQRDARANDAGFRFAIPAVPGNRRQLNVGRQARRRAAPRAPSIRRPRFAHTHRAIGQLELAPGQLEHPGRRECVFA